MNRYIILLLLIVSLVAFQNQFRANIKALLLISQEFPQIPVKPLHWVTREPQHEVLKFKNENGNDVIADVFGPSTSSGQAVIIAMGVKTAEKDRSVILGFAKSLARLGYVAMWPRLEALDEGVSKMEEPETLISSFKYIEKSKNITQDKISFVGFSVGSSIALVAAENPIINEKLNVLVFFGGYYDIFEYLKSLEEKTDWQPAEGATSHFREILEETGIDPKVDRGVLERFNPEKNISDFKAKIFILHERGDNFVPYGQSEKLDRALRGLGKKPEAYHVSNLFEHVQPKKALTKEAVGEFIKLYLFVARVFEDL